MSFLFNWKAALVCRETLVVAGVDGEWMEILSLTFLGNTVLSLNPLENLLCTLAVLYGSSLCDPQSQ